jgi:GNAT superfamily N-acetyltransferase/2'-5' RNA ligase
MNPLLQKPGLSVAPKGVVAKYFPPEIFHGTPVENVEKIKRDGLYVPNGGIYFAEDLDYAAHWGSRYAEVDEIAIVVVDPSKLEEGIVLLEDNVTWVYPGKKIPKELIKRINIYQTEMGSPIRESRKTATHKQTPGRDETFVEETNGYVNQPEKQKGTQSFIPLELMMPEEFGIESKAASGVPSFDQVLNYGGFWDTIPSGEFHQYLRENNINQNLPEEQLEVAAEQFLELSYAPVEEHLKELARTNRLPVYRAISASINQINPDNFGKFWSWEENAAQPYNAMGGAALVFKGTVVPGQVDWLATAYCNLAAPEEAEIRLIEGTTVSIIGWKENGGAWQNPPDKLKTVTAAKTAASPPVFMKGEQIRKFQQEDNRLMEETMYLRHSDLRQEPHFDILDDGKIVADCELYPNPNNPDQFWLMHITTRKGYEGRGYARQLLEAAVKFVQDSGRHELKISTFSSEGETKIRPVLERLREKYPDVRIAFSNSRMGYDLRMAKYLGKDKKPLVIIGLSGPARDDVFAVARRIPAEDLDVKGIEDDPHITVKFGVEENLEKLAWAVGEQHNFSVVLGKMHAFTASEAGGVPIVAEAHAADLHVLHELVDSAIGNRKDDFPYKPHVTIAYVKPEVAHKYEGSDWAQGISFSCGSLVLSRANGARNGVPFGSHKQAAFHSGHDSLKYMEPTDESFNDLLEFEAGRLTLLETTSMDPSQLYTQEELNNPEGSKQKAQEYADMWKAGSIPPPVPVSRLKDGRLVILNGQHRAIAALIIGRNLPIEIWGRKENKRAKENDERYPSLLTPDGMLEYVNSLHKKGWERKPFEDPEWIAEADEYVLQTIDINDPSIHWGQGKHPPVAWGYSQRKTALPPIVIGSNKYVVDGYHRRDAAKMRGDKTIQAYIGTRKTATAPANPSEIQIEHTEKEAGVKSGAIIHTFEAKNLQGVYIGKIQFIVYSPGTVAAVHNVWVEYDFRRQGYGSYLYRMGFDFLKEHGVKKVESPANYRIGESGKIWEDLKKTHPVEETPSATHGQKDYSLTLASKIASKMYNGGNSKPGGAVTYWTPNKEMAESYVEMYNDRFGTGGQLNEGEISISNPAPWDVIVAEASKLGINNEMNTPASIFDSNLHGTEVSQLVRVLQKQGYDGAILDDIAYGRQIQDKAFVKFSASKTANADIDRELQRVTFGNVVGLSLKNGLIRVMDNHYDVIKPKDVDPVALYLWLTELPDNLPLQEFGVEWQKFLSHKTAASSRIAAKVCVACLSGGCLEHTATRNRTVLLHYLQEATLEMAAEAQKIYDAWDQNEAGEDPENGTGGICDEIAQAITGVVYDRVPIECSVTEGGQPGDDHAYVIVYMDNEFGKEVYAVDIPHNVYETGGGYSWKKIPGVVFTPDHVEIFKLDLDPAELAKESSKKAGRMTKRSFKIEVPKASREHFWEEPPEGNLEFWAFRHPIVCLPGEKLVFTFDGTPVAETVVSHTEGPGKTECVNTGKYKDQHKVFWDPKLFKEVGKTASFSFYKAAVDEQQIRRSSMLAGLQLYGLPNPSWMAEFEKQASALGVDLKPYKYKAGSGLMWSPNIEQITAEQYAGLPLPTISKEKSTFVSYTDEIGKRLNQVPDAALPRTKIKITQPVPVLLQTGSSITRRTYSAQVVTLPAGSYTLQYQSSGGIVVPLSEIEQAGMEILPAVGKEKAQKRYSKGAEQEAQQVGTYLKEHPDQEFLYFMSKSGRVYLPVSLAKQVATISIPSTGQKDTLSPWAFITVDTFKYVFFPSTGKGIDAADDYHIFDPRLREKDGKVYMTGNDEGTLIVTLPPNADAILKALKQADLLNF